MEMASPKSMSKQEREWEVKAAADTLILAKEIEADPKLMAEVHKELLKRSKALKGAMAKK